MNWNKINASQLLHFQKLGKIRNSNPVVGNGKQKTLDVHTCIRYNDTDTILIRLKPNNGELISVDNIFPEGTTVTELYTGETASVNNGFVSFPRYENKIAIIKKLKMNEE